MLIYLKLLQWTNIILSTIFFRPIVEQTRVESYTCSPLSLVSGEMCTDVYWNFHVVHN